MTQQQFQKALAIFNAADLARATSQTTGVPPNGTLLWLEKNILDEELARIAAATEALSHGRSE